MRHTLSSMKGNRARRIDGWTPTEMLRLPKKAIEGLAGVLPAVEESLALQTLICTNVWPCWANQTELEKGKSLSRDHKYHRDDAVKGSSALQSGLLRRICEEAATLYGQPAVFFTWKSSLTVCVSTNSSIRHWSGISPNGPSVWTSRSAPWSTRAKQSSCRFGTLRVRSVSGPSRAASLGVFTASLLCLM